MKVKKIAKYTGLGIIIVILVAFVSMSFIIFDVISYTATDSQTLNPARNPVGNALVVYDPSISGTAKNVASVIASDLQAKGYKVNLAGIKSSSAMITSGYNVIVVGGPIYAGNVSGSVQSYLSTLNPPKNAKIGVFTTGGVAGNSTDAAYIRKEIPLSNNPTFQINAVIKVVNGNDINNKATTFVNDLLK